MRVKVRKNFRKSPCATFLYLGANRGAGITFQTEIARSLKKPITTINYHITKFKQEGLIDKYLKLTPSGLRLFERLWNDNTFSRSFRAHNLQVRFDVVKCPYKFPNCFSGKIYTPFSNGRYKGLQTKIGDIVVLFYSPKKIVCVLPDIFADKKEDILSVIGLTCDKLRTALENEFEGIRIEDHQLAQITTLHIAKMNTDIAQSFVFHVGNYKSNKIEIDQSKGPPEIETVDPRTAVYDLEIIEEMDRIKDMIKQEGVLKKNKTNIISKRKITESREES